MDQSANFKRGLAAVQKAGQFITPGSQEHAELLEAGYGMSLKRAKEILDEAVKTPLAYPYEVQQKAKALLEATKAKPVAISKKPGWKRDTEHQFFREAA